MSTGKTTVSLLLIVSMCIIFIIIVESDSTELNNATVLQTIASVVDWRTLGTHLGIPSTKLREIGMHPIEERKSRMVTAWLKGGSNCSWAKLKEALRKPSMQENRSAEVVEDIQKGSLAKDSSLEADIFTSPSESAQSNDNVSSLLHFSNTKLRFNGCLCTG